MKDTRMTKDLKPIDLTMLSVETLVDMANSKAELVEQNARKTVSDAIDCGRYLTAIKEQIEHGKWAAWLGVNWNYSQSLAVQYMRLSNSQSSANLKDAKSINAALRMISDDQQEKAIPARADRIPDRVEVVEFTSDVGQTVVQADQSVDSDNMVDEETDPDPTPDPPTIRKTAKGTEKVSEADKPRTQAVVPEILEDDPEEILPEEKTLSDFTFKEILEFIADSAAGDEKAVAKQLRKLADKLDPPTKFQKPDLEDCEQFFADNNGTEPEAFFDFYESKGWLVGKTSMKDWHAAARKWIRENAKGTYSNGTGQQPRLTTNQQREQNTASAFDRIRQAAADAAGGNGRGYISNGSGAADFLETDS